MSQDLDQQRVVYQTIAEPRLQAKILTNWSPTDKVFAGILAGGAIALWVWLGGLMFLISIICTIFLLYRGSESYGRLYWEIWIDMKSWYIDSVLGGVLWSAEPTGNRFVRRLRARYRGGLPLKLSRIVVENDKGVEESFGLLRQVDGNRDYLYIAADVGSFAGLDVNQEANAVNALASVINESVLRAGKYLKVGTSFLRITSPYDRIELAANLRRKMNPIVAHPERFNLDQDTRDWVDWSLQNLEEIRNGLVELGTGKNWYLIVLTIKSNLPRKEKKGGFSNKQLYEQPVVELGRTLVKNLQEASVLGLKNVRCLGMAELALVVRTSWDVVGLYDYMAARDRGEIPKNDMEIDEFLKTHDLQELNGYLRAWPERIISVSPKNGFMFMDDNYISTLRVNEMPGEVRADQFRTLHYRIDAGTWLRRAMVGEAVDGTAQTNQLVVSQSFFMNMQGALNSNNIVENPKIAKRRAALRDQTEEMSATTVAQFFNQLLTVVATSESLMLNQRKEVEVKYGASGFRSKVVPRSARQMDAAIGGMLGINRL